MSDREPEGRELQPIQILGGGWGQHGFTEKPDRLPKYDAQNAEVGEDLSQNQPQEQPPEQSSQSSHLVEEVIQGTVSHLKPKTAPAPLPTRETQQDE